MNINKKTVYIAVALMTPLGVSAQRGDSSKFAVNAHAQVGVGNALNLKPSLDFDTEKSSGIEYGVDFGWRFWQRNNHSLQVNAGVGYRNLSTDMALSKLDYSYSAPASADMDNETYNRYYELKDLKQKCKVNQLTIPVYLTYGYQCTDWLGVHADLGLKFGIKTGSKISDISGSSFSYGVYPQYDDLMIDAPYMNDFGSGNIGDARVLVPEVPGFSASVLVGAGLEFRLYGPLSADLGVRYNAGLTDIYKSKGMTRESFTAATSPLTYTVKDGTVARPLTDWLESSKLSHLSLNVSLICRF